MKRIATVISVMVVSMMFSAIAIFAADNYLAPFGKSGKGVPYNQKDECLLVAKNCATNSDTLMQRIVDLRKEIAKGLSVYTPDELKALKEQLKWIASDSTYELI